MPENSKKNKRGARGSVEDDVNEAKRQVKTSENMADNDNQENPLCRIYAACWWYYSAL